MQHYTKTVKEIEYLTYYNKNFSIITEWYGGNIFHISVYNERTRTVQEIVIVNIEDSPDYQLYLCGEKSAVEIVSKYFEQLKTKYIFDYDNRLRAD